MTRAVIATLGEDRPGLVSEISEIVLSLGLNIEDSRMTVLGGEFAVLMSVAGASQPLDQLQVKLEALASSTGLVYLFRRTEHRPAHSSNVYQVRVETLDHPGIVHGIAAFFSEHGINIRELETQTRQAAHTGAPVFNVEMEIEVAADALDALQEAFVEFCDDQGLDGELIRP